MSRRRKLSTPGYCIVALALANGLAMARLQNPQELTDEQRSAQKQNTNPLISSKLRLSEADLKWWREARVGMFIHWGLYAIPGEGEWAMHNKKIPADQYAKLAAQFKASKFDAKQWVEVAKSGHMKYMVLTARHHDGFALWDSPSSFQNFTSMTSAAHRDFVKEYADAARKAGMKVGIYYSPMDWRFPGYFKPHELAENAQLMKAQCYGQVRELMTNYGKIDILWYDGGWLAHQGTDADAAWLWDPIRLNTMVRKLQPKAVISPRSGWEGDFSAEEGSFESTGPIRTSPWEKCFSLGASWGYTKDSSTMPLSSVLRCLVSAVVRDGNVLINVGPDPDGAIPPGQASRIAELGRWFDRSGSSVFGTRGGPIQPIDGVCGTTYRGDLVYVHLLDWDGKKIQLPAMPSKVIAKRVLTGGDVKVDADQHHTWIFSNRDTAWPTDTIVELRLAEPVAVQPDLKR
ncbi:MAG: alpha-L-fucosidase [Armatimonadetes bacterium]|nr:alpha-L-fucosidase [Armatimonadota bacterium]